MSYADRITPALHAAARSLSTVVVVLCCSVASQFAQAVVLAPGDIRPIHDIPFDFSVLESKSRGFSINLGAPGTLQGHIVDVVFLVDGLLGFGTRVFVDQAPVGFLINKAGRTDFAGFTTDARPEPDLGGDFSPNSAARSMFGGSIVQFNFDDHPVPQDIRGSSFFVILTNATEYAEVGQFQAGVLSGAGARLSDPITVWAPVGTPVPEPAIWIPLIAGLGLLGTMGRHRRRTHRRVWCRAGTG